MIGPNEPDPILRYLEECAVRGFVPTVDQLEEVVNFRRAYPRARVLGALRRLAEIQLRNVMTGRVP